MGCAVACVASRCGMSYRQALLLFARKDLAWLRGYYCGEVTAALSKAGFIYSYKKFDPLSHSLLLSKSGTLVFVEPNSKYPAGHYFLQVNPGWMNPWSNYPHMTPVRASIQKKLDGKISYVIFEKTSSP